MGGGVFSPVTNPEEADLDEAYRDALGVWAAEGIHPMLIIEV